MLLGTLMHKRVCGWIFSSPIYLLLEVLIRYLNRLLNSLTKLLRPLLGGYVQLTFILFSVYVQIGMSMHEGLSTTCRNGLPLSPLWGLGHQVWRQALLSTKQSSWLSYDSVAVIHRPRQLIKRTFTWRRVYRFKGLAHHHGI